MWFTPTRGALLATLLALQATAVTVYTTATGAADLPAYTAASVDQTTLLQQPAAPGPQNPQVAVQLYDGGMVGMSWPVDGGFLGMSIELSVAAMMMGDNTTLMKPIFLNYCATLESRGGTVTIRVGGNTQDRAVLEVDGNANGKAISKTMGDGLATTYTPDVHFSLDVIKVMAEISKLVKVKWFFGIPFVALNADGNAGLVFKYSKELLGDNLLGLQLANEPDIYFENGKRNPDYNPQMFMTETAQILETLPVTEPIIVGPSICCFWNTADIQPGYIQQFSAAIKFVNTLRYPNNNCVGERIPQDILPNYLSHSAYVVGSLRNYFPLANAAIAAGKQFMMMETNTASCGGFPGISDAFAAALWGVDYAMQMAFGNFTYGLFHFGGQNDYYNPFTPPPTNRTKLVEWTTGPLFYSMIVVAEALGKGGKSQVMDLLIDDANPNRAGYAVYENGVPTRVVLVNYIGARAADYTANIAIGGVNGLPTKTPQSVRVKYLRSDDDTVVSKYKMTWANQTMGGVFESDGRLKGTPEVFTIQCQGNICPVPVYSPSVALVFLSDEAYANSGQESGLDENGETLTFATTFTTGHPHLTMNAQVLATSNGRSGSDPLGATSFGGIKETSDAAERSAVLKGWLIVGMASMLAGWYLRIMA